VQQNLLNAEFVSGEYRNAKHKNLHVLWVMKALTKELHKRFCCIYACLIIPILFDSYILSDNERI
jgi:hypothetical protein